MIYLILLMLLPVTIGLVSLFISKGRFNWIEFLCLISVVFVVMLIGFSISRWTAIQDTEIWSGRITSKSQDWVPCEHSYSCNCRTTCSSGKNSTCSTTCQTCYEHPNDWNWDLYTNIGTTIDIDRIDSRGSYMPPRWAAAYLQEPVAVAHSFTNYIKANPGSVLLRRNVKLQKPLPIPTDPTDVYDYYRVNRFIAVGYTEPHAKDWNWLLNQLNATYGPTKQVNVIIVAVKTTDPNYATLLEEKWLGGKKNDLVVVLGIDDYPHIAWAHVFSWSKSEELKVEVRDKILDISNMHRRDDIMAAIQQGVTTQWSRRHMKEFKYLMAGAVPGTGAMIFLFILGTLLASGLTIYFWSADPFRADIDSSPRPIYKKFQTRRKIYGRRYY